MASLAYSQQLCCWLVLQLLLQPATVVMLHQLPATDAAGQTLSAAAANALDATSH